MLDNRNIIPAGTMLIKQDDQVKIALWECVSPRILAVAAAKKGGVRTLFSMPDIVTIDPKNFVTDDLQNHPETDGAMVRNHEKNIGRAEQLVMRNEPVVVIAAPGFIPSTDLYFIRESGLPVMTVNSAIKTFGKPQYHISRDPFSIIMNSVNGSDVSQTLGIFSTCVFPDLSEYEWQERTWYTNIPFMDDKLPWCPSSEGTITDAVWFAVTQLGAKKIILVGVEQPPIDLRYFWEGVLLQAHCWFYAKHDIVIWNCTRATSVVSGVILGSLEEACQ